MIYLTKHQTQAAYDAVKDNLAKPQVALTLDNNTVHYQPDPCKSEIVKTTYELVDLALPSGVKWANKNIGALTVTDYGQKFQWGDIQGFTNDQVSGGCKTFSWADYKYSNNGGSSASDMTRYNSTDGKTVLLAEDDAAVANMGGSWRMPTETEFREIFNTSNCTRQWVTNYGDAGINGYLFTSVRNSNTLFFPAAGDCLNGSVYNVGSVGYYWSSLLNGSNDATNGRCFFFKDEHNFMNPSSRSYGFSVRGVVG